MLDAFSSLPEEVMLKYNINKNTFQDFVDVELSQDGSYERIAQDIEIAIHEIAWRPNYKTNHPFFTETQVELISTYVSGGEAHILTEPTEEKAMDALRAADGLLRCMAAVCDEDALLNPDKILKAAQNQILEAEKEAEAPSPGM